MGISAVVATVASRHEKEINIMIKMGKTFISDSHLFIGEK